MRLVGKTSKDLSVCLAQRSYAKDAEASVQGNWGRARRSRVYLGRVSRTIVMVTVGGGDILWA